MLEKTERVIKEWSIQRYKQHGTQDTERKVNTPPVLLIIDQVW